MGRYWRWILGGLALLFLLSVLFGRGGPQVEPGSVLVVQLEGSYVDASVNPLLGRLLGRSQSSLLQTTSELRKAARDPRIGAVLLRVRNLDVGWAQAQELRTAVAGLAETDRQVVALLEFEGFGNAEYFVASAAQRVLATPGHHNPFVGIAAEYLFFGGLLEKLGITVEYERIGRYKSAVESYAENKMSDSNREMTNALLDSVEQELVGGIAVSRGLTEQQVRDAIDAAPTTPEQLQAQGLIDGTHYFDALRDELGETTIEAGTYAQVPFEEVGIEVAATFAIVQASGAVVTGRGSTTTRGEPVMSSDTVADALREAAEDPEVAAIIFRIDSPGGSPLASDLIWQAVRDARDMGKPVVASLSTAAASGGYYVASAADRIVSQPTTFTGSIGVFVLRPVVGGLLEKLGVGVVGITRGARADLLLSSEQLSPGARAVLKRDVQAVYELFVSRVSEGRGLSPERVDELGRGRVWTGAQALEVGLVDALGGVHEAVREAKGLVGIDLDADVLLVPFPQPQRLADQVTELLRSGMGVAAPELPIPESLRRFVAAASELPSGTPLLIPSGWVEIH